MTTSIKSRCARDKSETGKDFKTAMDWLLKDNGITRLNWCLAQNGLRLTTQVNDGVDGDRKSGKERTCDHAPGLSRRSLPSRQGFLHHWAGTCLCTRESAIAPLTSYMQKTNMIPNILNRRILAYAALQFNLFQRWERMVKFLREHEIARFRGGLWQHRVKTMTASSGWLVGGAVSLPRLSSAAMLC